MMDIDQYLVKVAAFVADKKTPVVDLIAVQTKDPFKVLVATILSARTKDETTATASARLFEKAKTPAELDRLGQEEIAALIKPVGFFHSKAKYLKELPLALDRFKGQIPAEIDDLVTLPGVGRKTANLVRTVAFGLPAICVDTHVHRIMNIWGYVATKTPLETEMALRKQLPPRHWQTVNSLLVAFGQSLCKPVAPHCDQCPLANCPRIGVHPRKSQDLTTTRKTMGNSLNTLKFVSWNVNGIRAVEKKGFFEIVKSFDADIFAVQETKAQADQLSPELKNIAGYQSFWHSAERKGYSGVGIYSKERPISVREGIGVSEFDSEGRVLTLEFADFYFSSIYFPNSAEELKRLDFKIRFNEELRKFALNLAEKKSVVLCGDFNVAHKAIDLTYPERNRKFAGYTPQECAWMDRFLADGFVDTFRIFNQEAGQYTWWSFRSGARGKNIGWRIDYFCVDGKSRVRVLAAAIHPEIIGSDHCPVSLEFRVSNK
ncbi:MAG: exodeoxyribonuclease III [Desulfobulbaceae bacterium]|jgi:exodeoxyribonuclease-3|nr:exodeoxyribonuclease III [Desulfobulbaceae bacterium]